ncbi:hypothetical protein BDN72DRAFT_735812, partial [Pluteus cervinus]
DVLDESYLAFIEGVEGGTCGFYQLTREVFVVQGWDNRLPATATDKWYHLNRLQVGTENVYTCFCPASNSAECIHQRYLCQYGSSRFPEQDMPAQKKLESIVPFSLQCVDEDTEEYVCLFSVALANRFDLKARTIVSFQTTNPGTWQCQSDQRAQTCQHISQVQKDPGVSQLFLATTAVAGDESGGKIQQSLPTIDSRSPQSTSIFKSISYREIRPPRWASLPTDRFLYELPQPRPVPELIPLDEHSHCPCGGVSERYDPFRPTFQRKCTIYAMSRSYTAKIELQACPRGSGRHFIGPDGRDTLLFNYNNNILFTHALLNHYTSSFTTSETPFAAWVTATSQQYLEEGITPDFVSPDIFRSAWFAFVNIQAWEGDMACPTCGPAPSQTIWDGVTLAFHRKHLLTTIQPPTTIFPDAPSHKRKYMPNQQPIADPILRKLVRSFVSSAHLPTLGTIMQTDPGASVSNRDAIIELITDVPKITRDLTTLNTSLGSLFDRVFGLATFAQGIIPSKAYTQFMQQLCAEESILQMVTRQSLRNLRAFLLLPNTTTRSMLITSPAIFHVLCEHEEYSEDLRGTLEWVASRVETVLEELVNNTGTAPNKLATSSDTNTQLATLRENADWRKTGSCYSMPEIRSRPRYPGLRHDQKQESGGSRGAKCSKYYSTYGKQRLTGGIMGVWCTHSICYGFHFIPMGEGRNDVFSAIYTRWEKAPERVIYDFACALGPYCLLREPEFFADTTFNIDGFHAKDHTKCSPAAFLSSYSAVEPRLSRINSSAAECGNSGIGRIRKSVSYMTQERAIIYTRVFMGVWNRHRIRKLLKANG